MNALYSLLLLSAGIIPFLVSPLLSFARIASTVLYALGLVGLYASLGRRSRLGVAGLVLTGLALLATPLSRASGWPSSCTGTCSATARC